MDAILDDHFDKIKPIHRIDFGLFGDIKLKKSNIDDLYYDMEPKRGGLTDSCLCRRKHQHNQNKNKKATIIYKWYKKRKTIRQTRVHYNTYKYGFPKIISHIISQYT